MTIRIKSRGVRFYIVGLVTCALFVLGTSLVNHDFPPWWAQLAMVFGIPLALVGVERLMSWAEEGSES